MRCKNTTVIEGYNLSGLEFEWSKNSFTLKKKKPVVYTACFVCFSAFARQNGGIWTCGSISVCKPDFDWGVWGSGAGIPLCAVSGAIVYLEGHQKQTQAR